MATTVGNEDEVLDTLNNLIELDYDAVEAYQAAVDKLNDPTSKQAFASFQNDHERHVTELSAVVRQLGGTPPEKADMKAILTQGKVILGSLMGDKSILQAMKSNEDDTNTAYERASARSDLAPETADVLSRGLADERRHREWIVSRIEQIEASEAAAAQPGA
jgi:uncharacterized protein (TIGR02284 family)